jgi:hypothetical protein
MAQLNFSIHDLYNVRLSNPGSRISDFIGRQYRRFSVPRLSRVDLDIYFISEVYIPRKAVWLRKDMAYWDGEIYFVLKDGRIRFPAKDMTLDRMSVQAEKSLSGWHAFYMMEKMAQLKVLDKGYCFLHAGCVAQDEKAVVFLSPAGAGKTAAVLDALEKGSPFLGDEFVIANKAGFAFSYPRMLNINPYHGRIYSHLLRRMPYRTRLINGFGLLLMGMSEAAFFLPRRLKNRLKDSVKARGTLSFEVKEIFKEAVLMDKAPIAEILVIDPARRKEGLPERREIVDVILRDIRRERERFVYGYFKAFLAFYDEWSRKVNSYLYMLSRKEAETVSYMVKRCGLRYFEEGRKA